MKQVVIIGGGFGGLTLARSLNKKQFQVTLIDKNNFHQFQPLLYQVAIAGIDAEAICFPLRGALSRTHIKFRLASVTSIDTTAKMVNTDNGAITYDYLVIASGTITNYFNNPLIEQHSLPMKSAQDALNLRNRILTNLELASVEQDPAKLSSLLNIVIVGGGATGVEIAGSLAELKSFVIPRDFGELPMDKIKITLIEGSPKLLGAMSEKSSAYALKSLQQMGVEVITNTIVTSYDGKVVMLKNNDTIAAQLLIWVSGVVAKQIDGIPDTAIGAAGRIITNQYCELIDNPNVFAIGDVAIIKSGDNFIKLPQVAPVAIQQAQTLAANLMAKQTGGDLIKFAYKDSGSMATIGRNRAVADIGSIHLSGFIAWAAWLVIHLRSILGVKNKIVVLINWIWDYFSYRKSTGIIIDTRDSKMETD